MLTKSEFEKKLGKYEKMAGQFTWTTYDLLIFLMKIKEPGKKNQSETIRKTKVKIKDVLACELSIDDIVNDLNTVDGHEENFNCYFERYTRLITEIDCARRSFQSSLIAIIMREMVNVKDAARQKKVWDPAMEVFESAEGAQAWLTSPVVALGGKTPLEMMETAEGIELVIKELGRIKYGIIS
jgi:hypothetical protein